MNLDPSNLVRSSSPASSEASLSRPYGRAYEDGLKKDKSYRRYAANVERALSLFDTTLQEWADYISFLSRLLKALQSHPPTLSVVPEKVTVAKRLAQCLNPSLPSGVHQKALEVYGYIFGLLKTDGLARDLALYLPGFAPTLAFASLSVRPLFLSLIETYVAKLDPAVIRPALKAILLSLLPGLEEETSEDFETTLRIINKFRDIANDTTGRTGESTSHVDGQYFWQCLFLASITNPTRRTGVLAYLNRYLPKLGGGAPWTTLLKEPNYDMDLSASMASLTSPEPGLLIRCFATGLLDEQVLVQRNYLDLLVTHLPLHSPVLQSRITADDLELLVSAAAGVVIRRDMSLNRRLWSWFLGPEQANDVHENNDTDLRSITGSALTQLDKDIPKSQYFDRFGLEPLANSLKRMIARKSVIPQERAKPFRISLSLMDRWEVGGLIVPEIFLPVIHSVQEYHQIATSKAKYDEVFRSASAFFDGVESSLIFSELLGLVLGSFRDGFSEKSLENLRLANFAISNFNLKEEEMLTIHIPLLLFGALLTMKTLFSSQENPEGCDLAFAEAFSIARNLLSLIPSKAFMEKISESQSGSSRPKPDKTLTSVQISTLLFEFYAATKDTLDNPDPPFTPSCLAELLLKEAHTQILNALESERQIVQLKEHLNFFVMLLKKTPRSQVLRDEALYDAMYGKLVKANQVLKVLPMTTLSAICSIVTALYTIHETGFYISYEQICDIIPHLIQQLWELLSPSSPKFHVETARCLWLLHSITWHDHLVEAAITSLMIASTHSSSSHRTTVDQVERFFVLWNHSHQAHSGRSASRAIGDFASDQISGRDPQSSYRLSLLERPLFLSLDLLASGPGKVYSVVKQWLYDPSTVYQIFNILLSKLANFSYPLSLDEEHPNSSRKGSFDGGQCLYLLKTVSNTVAALNHVGWSALTAKIPPNSDRHTLHAGDKEGLGFQDTIAELSIMLLTRAQQISTRAGSHGDRLQEIALVVLHQLLLGPGANALHHHNLDTVLIEQLSIRLDTNEAFLQGALVDAILPALKIRFAHDTKELSAIAAAKGQRKSSLETLSHMSRLSFTADRPEKDYIISHFPQPPPQLLQCLMKGIRSRSSRSLIDKWVHFLTECLPLYLGVIFQILLKLVECLCKEISQAYHELQVLFRQPEDGPHDRSEHVTIALLAALENCIATAHDRLLIEEAHASGNKSPDQPQSFFGNMVSGVFAAEASQTRSATANDRLTVLLCFQDAVRLCYSIWAWGDGERSKNAQYPECEASFQYTSLRMRNRSRRILEHLFTAETLECLETLIELWGASVDNDNHAPGRSIFNLLHTLEGSRPKVAIPAIFNAIYSRTNPTALDPSRKSAMTSRLTEADLAAFLVIYAKTLEEDVLDEIWTDCTTFLRDVLSNPFPHRHILPRLLEFAAILGEKMEHTTFGEDQRAKKDLGDILLRLLTAISTSKPMALSQDPAPTSRTGPDSENKVSTLSKHQAVGPDDIYSILSSIMPALTVSLGDGDRIASAMSNISTNMIAPLFHARLFPQNVNQSILDLLQQMSKIPSSSKQWRKDVGDAFNDPKFFAMKLNLVKSNWLSLLRQWSLADKERLPELLSRLTQPASAGIMFGVGASAARLEADRKTQLNLRRISLLILAADEDHFSGDLSTLQQKLEDLLTATHVSSPSSATRAEVYMVLRALVLKTSAIHMASFWPMISTELQDVISSIAPGRDSETYNPYSLLQACKLLEKLLVISPDDFQLQEWLFVTDTIDVIYPPDRWESVALADEVARALGTGKNGSTTHLHETGEHDDETNGLWLSTDLSREIAKDEIVDRLLRPFFARLSIHAFESTYSMSNPDWAVCTDDLLADLFNDFTVAS